MSWIQVLNCQNCNQCLKCHKFPGLSFQLSKWQKHLSELWKWSSIVKIVKNCKNGQNYQNLSKWSKIVKIVENCQNCQDSWKECTRLACHLSFASFALYLQFEFCIVVRNLVRIVFLIRIYSNICSHCFFIWIYLST